MPHKSTAQPWHRAQELRPPYSHFKSHTQHTQHHESNNYHPLGHRAALQPRGRHSGSCLQVQQPAPPRGRAASHRPARQHHRNRRRRSPARHRRRPFHHPARRPQRDVGQHPAGPGRGHRHRCPRGGQFSRDHDPCRTHLPVSHQLGLQRGITHRGRASNRDRSGQRHKHEHHAAALHLCPAPGHVAVSPAQCRLARSCGDCGCGMETARAASRRCRLSHRSRAGPLCREAVGRQLPLCESGSRDWHQLCEVELPHELRGRAARRQVDRPAPVRAREALLHPGHHPASRHRRGLARAGQEHRHPGHR